ncbi:MAG TPA: O-methyltransferase [Candidatus Eisenbacteria bacterium]
MSGIVYPEIESYLAPLSTSRHEVLVEMEARAAAENIPIVGPLVGAFLFQMVSLRGARRIFELGSAIGYSTIWLALAAGPDAEIFYTDGDEAKAEDAARYFERAGVSDRITIKVGDALDMFDATGGDFDMIFNDVDKHDYPRVLEKALPRVRKGGLLVTDNVLWSGRVAHLTSEDDRETPAIQQYNELAASTPGCVYSIMPLRDGVGVLLKS